MHSVQSRLMFVTFLLAAVCGRVGAAAEPMQFGFSKVDVTPGEPLRLSGYGSRSKPFEGIDQKLWTRTMALMTADNRVHVLVSVDSIGFPGVLVTAIAQRLEKEHGIPRERFVLCSTHSHATPVLAYGLQNIFTTPLTTDEEAKTKVYTDTLADRVVQGVAKAIKDLAPGQLLRGEGKLGFAANRRVLKDGMWTGFGVNKDGPVDHTLPVLKVVDPQGKVRGAVFNYACHATTLGPDYNRVNGDWPDIAAEYLEEQNAGAVVLSVIGCGADANPEPRGKAEMAVPHGRAAALAVKQVLDGPLQKVTADPVASFGYAGLPLDRPSVAELTLRLTDKTPQVARHAATMLDVFKRMGRLPETYPMPVQSWRFGDDLTMIFLGEEVVVDYARRLKREIKAGALWITAYANDVSSYVASERIRHEGGYEVDRSMIYYNQPGPWAEGTEEVLIRRVHEVLKNPQTEAALSPADALKSFRLAEGFEIELVAAEPLIADPVNFAFGPDGKLWVVEMGDYPRGIGETGAPGGKILFLEDADGDGRFDKSTVFLDGLAYPTAVMPWKKGVLVTCAPDIFYAEDTDGDGKADQRKVLFTGFVESNPQHRVNGFAYGLDNWIYIASGAPSGKIKSLITGKEIDTAGGDVRIRPDEGLLEPVGGRTQYGRSRDDWGHWFGGDNSRPLQQFVVPDRYLRRNPHVPAPGTTVNLLTPAVAPPVFPASRTVDRFNDLFAANRFTSACSPMVFRDSTLGPGVEGAAFICEPVHNLVHRARLVPDGVTFRGERHPTEQSSEFLASTDVWFRPVHATTGPDGALWIADMYRHVIEHPQWIPEAWQKRLDLRAGEDKGRIYRVFRKGQRPRSPLNLTKIPIPYLVPLLGSTNGTVRDQVQQTLIERGDAGAIPLLASQITTGNGTPRTRLHALCTLDGLRALTPEVLTRALADRDPHVQTQAIRLCEPLLATNPPLGERLAALAAHQDVELRFHLALTLGEWDDPRAADALGKLAVRDAANPWMQAAILSSATKHAERMLPLVLAQTDPFPGPGELAERLIATAIGRDEAGVQRVLQVIVTRPAEQRTVAAWQIGALASLADALERRGSNLEKLEQDRGSELVSALALAKDIIAAARQRVVDATATAEERETAVRLLARGFDRKAEDLATLAKFLTPQTPPGLQAAAVATLARLRSPEIPAILLDGWRGQSPALQGVVVDTLLSRSEWTLALLDRVEGASVSPGDLDAATRSRFLNSRNNEIRARAAKVLAIAGNESRSKVVAEHQPVLELSGNLLRGATVFSRACATCHRVRGRGNELGANLAAFLEKPANALLIAILDPNQAVDRKFRNYVVALKDGRLLSGMIVEESSSSLTLASQNGRNEVLLRADVEELSSTDKSFMPEGLEKDLSRQDIADLIAFVRSRAPAVGAAKPQAAGTARKLLKEAGANGLGAVVAAPDRKTVSSWMGEVETAYCGAVNGAVHLVWRSAPLPAEIDRSKPYLFRVPVAMGGVTEAAARFELRSRGEKLAEFVPTVTDASWVSKDGRATLRYLALAADWEESSGVLEIELSADLIPSTGSVEFTVVPPAALGRGWFGLLPFAE